MRLTKHHGLGNDFLVLLDMERTHPVTGVAARAICDRHRGVGADGLLRVTPGSTAGDVTDVTMELFNADGGRAEMSGNGIGCLAQAVVLAGVAHGPTVTVATDAGKRSVHIAASDNHREHRATVDMGVAKVADEEADWVDDQPLVVRAARVDVGNPHLAFYVSHLTSDEELIVLGRGLNDLIPGGINVELVALRPQPDELTMQVYERGVGLTEACGTGACAVAAASEHWGLTGAKVRVHQPGGTADIVIGSTIAMTVPVVHVANIDIPE
jgi:diaminopimelate epimerase